MSLFPRRTKRRLDAGKVVHAFGFGHSPFSVPSFLVSELQKHAHKCAYEHVLGCQDLREKISQFLFERSVGSFHPNNVIIGPGSKELIFLTQLVFNGSTIFVDLSLFFSKKKKKENSLFFFLCKFFLFFLFSIHLPLCLRIISHSFPFGSTLFLLRIAHTTYMSPLYSSDDKMIFCVIRLQYLSISFLFFLSVLVLFFPVLISHLYFGVLLLISCYEAILIPSPSWVSYAPQSVLAHRPHRFIATEAKNNWCLHPIILSFPYLDFDAIGYNLCIYCLYHYFHCFR